MDGAKMTKVGSLFELSDLASDLGKRLIYQAFWTLYHNMGRLLGLRLEDQKLAVWKLPTLEKGLYSGLFYDSLIKAWKAET